MDYELPFYLDTQIVKGAKLIEKSGVIKKYKYKLTKSQGVIKSYTYEKNDLSGFVEMQVPIGSKAFGSGNQISSCGVIMDMSDGIQSGGYDSLSFIDISDNTWEYVFNVESKESISGGVTTVTYTLYADIYKNGSRLRREKVTSNNTGEFAYYFYVRATGTGYDTNTDLLTCSPSIQYTNGTTATTLTSPGKLPVDVTRESCQKLKYDIVQNEEVQNVDAI